MSIFTSFFPARATEKKTAPKEIFILTGNGKYGLRAMGEELYQIPLEIIYGPRTHGSSIRFETAWLILEDSNNIDPYAVRVEIRNRQVGYLSPETAILYRQLLMQRHKLNSDGQCKAVITGGWVRSDGRKSPYEVWLDTPDLIY